MVTGVQTCAFRSDGQFIGGASPFDDNAGGKNTANTLIAQGADIILPVAGPSGLGALAAVKETNGKVNAIWVDRACGDSSFQRMIRLAEKADANKTPAPAGSPPEFRTEPQP